MNERQRLPVAGLSTPFTTGLITTSTTRPVRSALDKRMHTSAGPSSSTTV